jgi:uncharacterized protein (TIGR02594 family)
MVQTSAFKIASHFIGVKETPGSGTTPQIATFLMTEHPGNVTSIDDEIAWCSAFIGYVAYLLDLERPALLGLNPWRARYWLKVGTQISITEAQVDCDVVIFMRGTGIQPGPDIVEAPGHVGLYGGIDKNGNILCLAGNQGDQVSIASFLPAHLLGVRRLSEKHS